MLHNKQARAWNAWLALDVTFVHGSAAEIRAGKACPELVPGDSDTCMAGRAFHGLDGEPWRPRGLRAPPGDPRGLGWTAPYGGPLVRGAGHVHANGIATALVNLGPPAARARRPCTGTASRA